MTSLRLLFAVAAALLAACATTPETPAPTAMEVPVDLVIRNVRIAGQPGKTTVLVAGERIAAVGDESLLNALAAKNVKVIDGAGGWLFPGFHDAHLHMMGGGLSLARVYLVGTRTMDEVATSIRTWATQNKDRPWVLGRGYPYEIIEKKPGNKLWQNLPTKEMLDAIVPDRPAVIRAYDGHTAWANSLALKAAGIDRNTKDPADGTIVRRDDGEPSGALLEGAYELVLNVIPKPSRAEQKAALQAAAQHVLALGVTSADAIEPEPIAFELFLELEKEGLLPIDVNVFLPIEGDFAAYEKMRQHNTSRVRFVGVKGFVDGVIESKTAFMLHPYTGTEAEIGRPLIPAPVLKSLVADAHRRGFQVSLHAIGDAGVRLALDAIAEAQAAQPSIPVRHRLEHIEVIDEVDMPRFSQLRAIASMQPYHAIPYPPDANVGAWPDNAGKERLLRSWAWKSLASHNAPLTFGSDWPVYTASPLSGMAMAVTRQNEKGFPPGGWNAHQAISFDAALHAYTVERGAPLGEAQQLGRIQAGDEADIVIYPASVDPQQPTTWFDANAQVVIVDGHLAINPASH